MYIYVFPLLPFRPTFWIHSNCVSPCLFSLYFPSTFYPSFLCVICPSSWSWILPPLRPSLCRVKWPRPPACPPASICPRPWCRCCWTRSWNRSAWGPFSSSTSTSSSANVSWSGFTLRCHCLSSHCEPKRHWKRSAWHWLWHVWWCVVFVFPSLCQFGASSRLSRRHSAAGLYWSATGKPFHCEHENISKVGLFDWPVLNTNQIRRWC